MKVVGIIGFAGSGKDTVGKFLIDEYNFTRYSFAKPLKDITAILFNWDRELLDGITDESRAWREIPDEWWENKLNWRERHNQRFTPRVALQYLGTNTLRDHFDDNIWINCFESYLRTSNTNIVITDCRFPNELKAIRKFDSKIIRVTRGPEPDWYNKALEFNKGSIPLPQELTKIHPSERDWIGSNFDEVIHNDQDLNYLKQRTQELIKEW